VATGVAAAVLTAAEEATVAGSVAAALSLRTGAGLSGSGWPGYCRAIHRETLPSP
jgi:hypothetical protein